MRKGGDPADESQSRARGDPFFCRRAEDGAAEAAPSCRCAILAKVPTLEDNLEHARKRYAELKARAEAQVVRWQWATFTGHCLEPCYFERHRFGRGRPLASHRRIALPVDITCSDGIEGILRVAPSEKRALLAGRGSYLTRAAPSDQRGV